MYFTAVPLAGNAFGFQVNENARISL